MNKKFLEFSVSVYGNLEKYNEVLSKARCRIFYKYGNRNGTYITDEFAEKLCASLPYAPVKGIYEYDDFTDHGTRRTEGRVYGIVPENPNVSWEKHIDDDGVERTYACCDVLIFTALYKEATEIVGKSQSMELFEPAMKYHQEIIQGQKWIVFDDGCFLGLQVLGDDVEPCFESASFYSLHNSIEEVVKKIEEYSTIYAKGGKDKMDKINFKLSDSQKHDALWTLLNPEFTEEGNWTISYAIMDVYDDYALCFNYETQQAERVYYTKDDETDSLALGEKKIVYIMDITEEEKNTLDTLRKLNGDTYELVNENLTNAEKNAGQISEFNHKIEELQNQIDTLNTEKTNSEDLYTSSQEQLNIANEELNSLREFKLQIEAERKEAVLDEYAELLDEEILNNYKNNLEDYTIQSLDMELAYELKKSNPTIFSKTEDQGYVPKDNNKKGTIEAILDAYKNK